MEQHRATLHAAIVREGLTAKQTRVAGMQERHRRMWQLLEARAAAGTQAKEAEAGTDAADTVLRTLFGRGALPPGVETGLLVKTVKQVGKVLEEEWAVDTGLLSEMRATEKQVAQELGEWTEKRELSGKDGAPLRIDLTGLSDDELATLQALRHKLAAQPGGD
jgi:hypothetical protein